MKTRVNWIENVMFVAESDSGHAIVVDGVSADGGRSMGMRPMERCWQLLILRCSDDLEEGEAIGNRVRG